MGDAVRATGVVLGRRDDTTMVGFQWTEADRKV